MKRIIILVLLFVLPSCITNKSLGDKRLNKNDIFITAKFKDYKDMKPSIAGSTNLPENTTLMIGINRQEAGWGSSSKTKVINGKFQTHKFNVAKFPLPSGFYNISIITPLTTLQPQEVRNIIGNKGENLKGNLIKNMYGFNIV